MRDGQYEAAREALNRALSTYEKNSDITGQASVLLSLGELSRMEQKFAGAEVELERVTSLAQTLGDQQLEGQAVTALAALNLQLLKLDESLEHYSRALHIANECGDMKLEAYVLVGLGEVQSRAKQPDALESIIRGAQGFARLGNEHGMGAAMLRLAQHSVRVGRPVLALVAAESARRLWRRSDPIRGVGQTLRIIVKALAAIKRWEEVLAVSKARVVVAGALQPNALEVYEFYREKAPPQWVEYLEEMDDRTLWNYAEERIDEVIGEVVTIDSAGVEIGTILGSMSTIEKLLTARLDKLDSSERIDAGEPPQEMA